MLDGKKIFREACEAKDIECDKYFKLGCQNTVSGNGYVFHCLAVNRTLSQLYVVNYISSIDLYVAWSLNDGKKRTYNSFRILKDALSAHRPGEVVHVPKALEYPGWDSERVFIFDRDAIQTFLDKSITKTASK